MRQLTLATVNFDKHRKRTRRAAFLAEMERIVPWQELCALIEPLYPKPGNGRPPIGLERMLRVHFLQHWFDLSDPAAEEALYEAAIVLKRSVFRNYYPNSQVFGTRHDNFYNTNFHSAGGNRIDKRKSD